MVLVMLLPGLNTVQVSIMEARHFISAHEMVADGHWLLTTMNGEPRYEKPPLPTWLSAFLVSYLEQEAFCIEIASSSHGLCC